MGPKQRGISLAVVLQVFKEEKKSQGQCRHGLKGSWREDSTDKVEPGTCTLAVTTARNYFGNNAEKSV